MQPRVEGLGLSENGLGFRAGPTPNFMSLPTFSVTVLSETNLAASSMAPIRPQNKPTSSARKAASGRGEVASSKAGLFQDEFRTTKKDKRMIKHSAFMAKVAKSYQKAPKRRRPSKKLVTNLDSLADALPAAEQGDRNDVSNQVNIIKQKTLKSGPGAMKRKEKLERMERDRFMKNLAQMTQIEAEGTNTAAGSSESQAEPNSTSSRWAALRGFISQTMEQQPAFKNK
ncbi:hypothetical protein VTN77DRAFT_8078 [Rasamsonia byssochlamydoides]|uniref:uncharacterized protein n=1 Tax=Rasamsonia byssochlamydoides TaxID=89139 RepID=UPI0037423D3B